MRLALLYHQFISRGGLEGYLWEFASRLSAHGHELTLVGCRFDERFRSLAANVHEIPASHLSARMLRQFAAASADLVPQLPCDAVLGFGRTWCQDVHRAGGGCHAVYSRQLPRLKRWRWKNRLELALERKLYTAGRTRAYVVNSHMVARELQSEYAVDPAKITVIRTGVDANHWQPPTDLSAKHDQRRRVSPHTPPDRPVWLFVSLDHRRKGLATLLQAAAQVSSGELWIVGAPLDSGWRKMINQLRLHERLRDFGRQTDLRPFYQAADLLVHPTTYDACSNTVLQALASGLPGVISQNDGASEFIHHGQNGFLLPHPSDAHALAELLHLAASQKAPALSIAARKSMLPLTWESHLTSWEALLQKLR